MKRIPKFFAVVVAAAVVGLLMGSVPVAAKTTPAKPSAQAGDNGGVPEPKSPKSPGAAKKAPEGKVNLNTATVEQLQTLPKVGAKMAQRIVEYRTANKGFKTVDELRNVKGIGPKVFESLKPYLTL